MRSIPRRWSLASVHDSTSQERLWISMESREATISPVAGLQGDWWGRVWVRVFYKYFIIIYYIMRNLPLLLLCSLFIVG